MLKTRWYISADSPASTTIKQTRHTYHTMTMKRTSSKQITKPFAKGAVVHAEFFEAEPVVAGRFPRASAQVWGGRKMAKGMRRKRARAAKEV